MNSMYKDETQIPKRYVIAHFFGRLGVTSNEQAVKSHLLEYIRLNPNYFDGHAEKRGRTFYLDDCEEVVEMLRKALDDSGLTKSPRDRKLAISWCAFVGQYLSGNDNEDRNKAKRIILDEAKKGHLAKAVHTNNGASDRLDIYLGGIPAVLEVLRKNGYNPMQRYEGGLDLSGERYNQQVESENEAARLIRVRGCENFSAKPVEVNFKIPLEERVRLLEELEERQRNNPNTLVSPIQAQKDYKIPPLGLGRYHLLLGTLETRADSAGWNISGVIEVQKQMIRIAEEKARER